jgi:hypothetical protein
MRMLRCYKSDMYQDMLFRAPESLGFIGDSRRWVIENTMQASSIYLRHDMCTNSFVGWVSTLILDSLCNISLFSSGQSQL